MYKIEINYTTGNSFGSEDCETELEITWNDLEKAQKALDLITEHYELYCKVENDRSFTPPENKNKLYKNARKTEWYKNALKKSPELDKEPFDMVFYSLGLETDTGEIVIISPFWIGYFECLNSARVTLTLPTRRFR